jgi:hypothetical protein
MSADRGVFCGSGAPTPAASDNGEYVNQAGLDCTGLTLTPINGRYPASDSVARYRKTVALLMENSFISALMGVPWARLARSDLTCRGVSLYCPIGARTPPGTGPGSPGSPLVAFSCNTALS